MLYYDPQVFDKFRKLAVTDVDRLMVGRRYWSSWTGKSFVLKEVLSAEEYCRRRGDHYLGQPWVGMGEWLIGEEDSGRQHSVSTHDSNVGASYNPWLLFDSESTMEQCMKELTVSYEHDC